MQSRRRRDQVASVTSRIDAFETYMVKLFADGEMIVQRSFRVSPQQTAILGTASDDASPSSDAPDRSGIAAPEYAGASG